MAKKIMKGIVATAIIGVTVTYTFVLVLCILLAKEEPHHYFKTE